MTAAKRTSLVAMETQGGRSYVMSGEGEIAVFYRRPNLSSSSSEKKKTKEKRKWGLVKLVLGPCAQQIENPYCILQNLHSEIRKRVQIHSVPSLVEIELRFLP